MGYPFPWGALEGCTHGLRGPIPRAGPAPPTPTPRRQGDPAASVSHRATTQRRACPPPTHSPAELGGICSVSPVLDTRSNQTRHYPGGMAQPGRTDLQTFMVRAGDRARSVD